MQAYGPYTLTANTIQEVDIGEACDRVFVGNDSPYDILVAFTPYQPPVVTSAQTPWVAWVQSKQGYTIPIQDNATLGGWSGRVWLLPLNTRNTTQALNGTIPSTANALVQSLLPGEPEPPAAAYQDQITLASQPRVIAIPVAPTYYQSVGLTWASPASPAKQLGNILNLPAGIAGSGAEISAYLHFVNAFKTDSSTGWGLFSLRAVTLNNASAVVDSTEVLQFVAVGVLAASGQGQYNPAIIAPPVPLFGRIFPSATAVTTTWQLALVSSQASGTVALAFSFGAAIDTLNTNKPIPGIGTTAQSFTTGSGTY